MLSRTQAGPGRTVKQEQEEISRNHVQAFEPIPVQGIEKRFACFAKQEPGRARQKFLATAYRPYFSALHIGLKTGMLSYIKGRPKRSKTQ